MKKNKLRKIIFYIWAYLFYSGQETVINRKTSGRRKLIFCFEGLSYSLASEAPDQAPREPTDGTDGRTGIHLHPQRRRSEDAVTESKKQDFCTPPRSSAAVASEEQLRMVVLGVATLKS